MADHNDKNRSILQMLRARAAVSGGQGGYEVARTTVIRCPGCGVTVAHGAERHGCTVCGHAFRSAETGAEWYRQKDAADATAPAGSLVEVGGF